jgi:glyoxylase-like metal-dependent hydrolase (beta-lactamase superfamily II)
MRMLSCRSPAVRFWTQREDALQRRRLYLRLPARAVSMDMRQALASVEKMAQLDVGTLCFGHGQPVTEGAGEMLEELLSRSREARSTGGRLSGPA